MLDSILNLLQSLNVNPDALKGMLPGGQTSPEVKSPAGTTPTPPQMDLSQVLSQAVAGTPGKGMDDDIPAVIDGQQPAALSQGEFVIPADVVSLLGDGHSESGAKVLESFLDSIRKLKTGSADQPTGILELLNPKKTK